MFIRFLKIVIDPFHRINVPTSHCFNLVTMQRNELFRHRPDRLNDFTGYGTRFP